MSWLNDLKSNINNFLTTNPKTILYFGIGSYHYKTNSETWNYENNQQFPPFLHDFKLKDDETKILIILIDPQFEKDPEPHIVQSTNTFLVNSWINQEQNDDLEKKNNSKLNIYNSSLGIKVITIGECVNWYSDDLNDFNDYENFITELCIKISDKKSNLNTILFYHEFIGTNVILFENKIKKKMSMYETITFDESKICIDITRGAHMSCYFNLSNPEFYPIILIDYKNNIIKYANPQLLSNEEKMKIISDNIKYTYGFNYELSDCIFSPTKPNNLFEISSDTILCFQIIKFDKIILDLIQNGIIPLIRQLNVCKDNEFLNKKMWGISHIENLKTNLGFFQSISNFDKFANEYVINIINSILDNLLMIILIKDEKSFDDNDDNEYILNSYKNTIINDLFDLVKIILTNILIKYKVDVIMIENFIFSFKNLDDKYELVKTYKNFISNLNIF